MGDVNRLRAARVVAALTVLALVGAAAWPVRAAEAEGEQTSAAISALAIRADNEEKPYVDPALAPIRNELKRFPYNAFRLANRGGGTVERGKVGRFALIEDYALAILVKRVTGDKVDMEISVVRYEVVDGKRKERVVVRAPMTIRKGKYILLGEFRLEEGVLVAAVAAR